MTGFMVRLKNRIPPPLTGVIRSIKRSSWPCAPAASSPPRCDVNWDANRTRNLMYLEELNSQFPERSYLAYDDAGLMRRSEERMKLLQEAVGSLKDKKVLEIGAGLGENIFVLTRYASMAVGTDILRFLRARKQFTQLDQNEARVPWFVNTNAETLPFRNDSFDVVFSYNAFEHFNDPQAAFNESLRVLKPNGLFHTRFGPLFRSAWGAHIYNRIYIPWVQLLFPAKVVRAFYDKHGWDSDKNSAERPMYHWLNQYYLEQFRRIFFVPGATVLFYREIPDNSQDAWLSKIRDSLREYSSSDLLVSTIEVLVQKIPFPEIKEDVSVGCMNG